jgi:trimethylamine:corrinoid methyltransferase-like protein
MGLSAYDADGRKRFHLFRDEPIYFVQVSEPYAYVWRETSVPPAVVDLRSGRIVGTLDDYRDDLPVIVSAEE